MSEYTDALMIPQKVDAAIAEKAAITLKEQWNNVRILINEPNTTPLADAEYRRMGAELARTGQFNYKEQEYSLADLKENAEAKLADLPAETRNGLLGQLDVSLPLAEQKAKIGNAIEEGVEENTGFMANIMNAIKGFISWLVSMFSGENEGMGLMDHIRMSASANIRESVGSNLGALSQEEGMGKLLNRDNINGILDEIHTASMNYGKDAKDQITKPDALATTRILDISAAAREMVADQVRGELDASFVPTVSAAIKEKGGMVANAITSEADIKTLQTVVEEKLVGTKENPIGILTDPANADLSKDQLRAKVATEVQNALLTDERTAGMTIIKGAPIPFTSTPDTAKQIGEQVADQITEKHETLKTAMDAMKAPDNSKVALEQATQRYQRGENPTVAADDTLGQLSPSLTHLGAHVVSEIGRA